MVMCLNVSTIVMVHANGILNTTIKSNFVYRVQSYYIGISICLKFIKKT